MKKVPPVLTAIETPRKEECRPSFPTSPVQVYWLANLLLLINQSVLILTRSLARAFLMWSEGHYNEILSCYIFESSSCVFRWRERILCTRKFFFANWGKWRDFPFRISCPSSGIDDVYDIALRLTLVTTVQKE